MTDALVRVAFANGNSWTARLTPSEPSAAIPASQSAWAVFATYVRHGIEHIAFGFDHLLFVAGLMLIVRDWRKLVKAITAFTVAHSITLTCATLALGDAAVAAGRGDDRGEHRHGRGGSRAHGARRSSASRSSGHGWWPSPSACCTASALPARWSSSACRRATSRWRCFAFNVGVELGQLAFIAVLLSAVYCVRRLVAIPREATVASAYAIGIVAAFWCAQRLDAMFS